MELRLHEHDINQSILYALSPLAVQIICVQSIGYFLKERENKTCFS